MTYIKYNLEGKFDTIIAADVIYEEEQVEPLIQTVTEFLKCI
jgi:predicted nicotinamide N-methyase